jgi:energy-coupling factor transporter ATP-binding protein EcfA2
MSDYRMVYLVGQPGSGKSTLMRRLTAGFERLSTDIPVPHDQLFASITGAVTHAEIGRQRGDFSGTDALASSIITRAEPWILSRPYPVVLGEGARLGNHRFLTAAAEGYDVLLAVLDHGDAQAWHEVRSKQLGKFQNAGWVKGRLTASRNLAEDPPAGVRVLRGHPDELYAPLADFADVPNDVAAV